MNRIKNTTYVKSLQVFVIVITILSYLETSIVGYGSVINAVLAIFVLLYFVLSYIFGEIKLSLGILVFTILSIALVIFSNFTLDLIGPLIVFLTFKLINQDDSAAKRGLLKTFIVVSIIMFLIIALSYFLFGFNQQFSLTHWRLGTGYVFRHSLGFTHPNQAMMKAFTITIAVLLYLHKRLSLIVFAIFPIMVFLLTNSQASFFLLIIPYLGVCLLATDMRARSSKIIPIAAFLVVFAVTYYLAFAHNEPNDFVNRFLTGRPYIWRGIIDYGHAFFGNPALNYEVVDNSILQLTIVKGIGYTILFAFTIFLIIFDSSGVIRLKNSILLIFVFLVAIMEVMFMKFDFILLIIFLSSVGNIVYVSPKGETISQPINMVAPFAQESYLD